MRCGWWVTRACLTLGALALVWPTVRRLGWGYGVYAPCLVGHAHLSSKDFMGMGRYLLSAFPLFLTLALLLRERPARALGRARHQRRVARPPRRRLTALDHYVS